MSRCMKMQGQLKIDKDKKMISAVLNGHCVVFYEEYSSFCFNAEVSTEYLWIIREAAAAVNSGVY